MDPPPSSPPALISFVGGPDQSSSHLRLSRHQQLRSRPSESDAEPEAEYRREGLTHGPVVHHNIQPLQCNPSDDDGDEDENNVSDSTLLQQSHSPQLTSLPPEINDDDDDDDDQFRQRIAQKMLTATTTRHSPASSSTRNINHQICWEEEGENENNDVQFHSIPETRYFPAPWETPPLPPPPTLSPPSYYPPPLNFSRMQESATATNTTIIDDNAIVMHSRPPAGAATTTTINNNTTPKSVTFRTQDQVHQFDEQLELFKYVDEEFFRVAHYLLEVVDFEDRTNNRIDHHDHDNSSIVFGKEDPLTFSEWGTDRRRHRDGGGGGRHRPGLLSQLCGCGLGVGNDDDIDYGYGMQNESINEELHNNEIEHNQRNKDWRGYQLSTKLVSNFVSALNFRMDNIQSKLDGDVEIGEEDALVAARTREVVRKVNTYGLPLMIPQHSSRCEWNVPSKFIALDTNNVVVSLLCVCMWILSMHLLYRL